MATQYPPSTRRESVIERLQRLADKARSEGVRLCPTNTAVDLVDDWCMVENPKHGTWYVVSIAEGCTCPGYWRTGACKHLAALMTAAGVIPQSADAIAWARDLAAREAEDRAAHIAELESIACDCDPDFLNDERAIAEYEARQQA